MSMDEPVFEKIPRSSEPPPMRYYFGLIPSFQITHLFLLWRSLIDSLLSDEYGHVKEQQIDGQVMYMLDLQRQVTNRVRHGLVPPSVRPIQQDLHVVGDFLKSPCVDFVYQNNQDFLGSFCFLSIWADGGRVFPSQRGGHQKSLWAVMVLLFPLSNACQKKFVFFCREGLWTSPRSLARAPTTFSLWV